MDSINMDGIWELSSVIGSKDSVRAQGGITPVTIARVDQTGKAWGYFPGSDTETPINGLVSADVKPGDVVQVDISGNNVNVIGNATSPAVGEREVLGITDPIKHAVSTAQAAASNALQIAQEAAEIAGDTSNHFWDDTNGAHVTDVEEDAWNAAVEDNFSDYDETTKPYRNILVGRLGILLRSCLNNLVSITRSAIAFFDGTGNNASNIIASFGANGAQIGKLNSTHMELDSDSLDLISVNGGEIATFGSSPRGIGISFLDGVAAILAQTNTYGTEDLLISSENGMRLMTGLENGSGTPAAAQVHTIAGLDSDWESFANWQTVADGFATSDVNILNAKFEANAYNAAGTVHPELRNVSIGMAIEADIADNDYPLNVDAGIGISAEASSNKSAIYMSANEATINIGNNGQHQLNEDSFDISYTDEDVRGEYGIHYGNHDATMSFTTTSGGLNKWLFTGARNMRVDGYTNISDTSPATQEYFVKYDNLSDNRVQLEHRGLTIWQNSSRNVHMANGTTDANSTWEYSFESAGIYKRTKSGSTWSSWTKIA